MTGIWGALPFRPDIFTGFNSISHSKRYLLGLLTDGKKETAARVGITETEHQMGVLPVIVTMPIDAGVASDVSIPLIPGTPVAVIVITAAPVFVVSIVSSPVMGTF
jgi:hypothetical protein